MTGIRTPEELDALPVGSVVLWNRRVWQRFAVVQEEDVAEAVEWMCPDGGFVRRGNVAQDMAMGGPRRLLPATVLYRPDAPAPAVEDREALGRVRAFADSWAGQAHAPERVAFTAADVEGPDGEVLTLSDLRALVALAARQPAPVVSAEQVERARDALLASLVGAATFAEFYEAGSWDGRGPDDPAVRDAYDGIVAAETDRAHDGTGAVLAELGIEVTP